MRLSLSLLAVLALSVHSAAQSYHYYFGNLHSHTGFSDGNKDSLSSGVSKPDGSYSYAKLSSDFHFLGISEHNHYSSARNPGFRRPLYQQGLQMADAANQDGTFVCLFGMEYGVSSDYNGHVILYGFDKLLGWESCVPGVSGNNYDVFNAKTDYASLFAKVNAKAGAFAYLAHPNFDDFASDGTYNSSLANGPYNASFDSAIVGMPLRSGLATNGGQNYSDYPQGHYFNYYKRMLYKGYHLGLGYDHDNHYTNFGRGNGGRLALLAPSLSRQNVMEAMRAMRFYGSDDSNAEIDFSCNGRILGSVFRSDSLPTLHVVHHDPDGELADSIKIWKGKKESGDLWASIVHYNTGNNALIFTDEQVTAGEEYYYFAEIRQKDGQWIVTSPVWYTGSAALSLSEPGQAGTLLFFDPSSSGLFAVAAESSRYVLTVTDAGGKVVQSAEFSGRSIHLDLHALNAGIYIARLQNSGVQRIVKFAKP